VQIRDIDEEVAARLNVKENTGVLVTKVFPDSPGAKGGLKMGDIVMTVGGKLVSNGTELQKAVLNLPLGQPVEVALIRDGEAKLTKITIEEQPEDYGISVTRDRDE
jgi:serine protease Do